MALALNNLKRVDRPLNKETKPYSCMQIISIRLEYLKPYSCMQIICIR